MLMPAYQHEVAVARATSASENKAGRRRLHREPSAWFTARLPFLFLLPWLQRIPWTIPPLLASSSLLPLLSFLFATFPPFVVSPLPRPALRGSWIAPPPSVASACSVDSLRSPFGSPDADPAPMGSRPTLQEWGCRVSLCPLAPNESARRSTRGEIWASFRTARDRRQSSLSLWQWPPVDRCPSRHRAPQPERRRKEPMRDGSGRRGNGTGPIPRTWPT